MDKIKKDISDVVVERVKSPFIASFLISWCAINWKFFALLFLGKIPVVERVNEAEKVLSTSTLYYSLFIAAVYTFIWPWFSHLITSYQAKIKFIRTKQIVDQDHELELKKTGNKLANVRLEINEQNLVEKLIKTQGQFKKTVQDQKAFIKETDALLAQAEEKFGKISELNYHMFSTRQEFETFNEIPFEQKDTVENK